MKTSQSKIDNSSINEGSNEEESNEYNSYENESKNKYYESKSNTQDNNYSQSYTENKSYNETQTYNNNTNNNQTSNENYTTSNNQTNTLIDQNEIITYIDRNNNNTKKQNNKIIKLTSSENINTSNNNITYTNPKINTIYNDDNIITTKNNNDETNEEIDSNYKNDENYIPSKNLYKKISLELMKIILNSKLDINILLNKNEYIHLYNSLQNSETEYYIVHNIITNSYNEYETINNKTEINNENIVKQFENFDYLFYKPLLFFQNKQKSYEMIMYKSGQTFSNSLVKRYGIINNNIFFSSNDSLKEFKPKNAKDKTLFLKDSEILIEDKNSNQWTEDEINYRITIKYKENNKIKYFFLYSNNQHKIKEFYHHLHSIKMELNSKNNDSKNIQNSFENIMTNSIKTYFVMKMILVKRKVKNRILIKEYINNKLKQDKKEFGNFLINLKNKIIGFNEKQNTFPFYHEKKYIICSKTIKDNNNLWKINVDILKKCVNIIYNFMKMKQPIKSYKNIGFNVYINNSKETLIVDYKNGSISSMSKRFKLSADEINNISNIIYNISENNQYLENGLLLLMEKIDKNKSLHFQYKEMKNETFFEFENKVVNKIKNSKNLTGYMFQIFHCLMSKTDFRGLNLIDSYFYVEIKSYNKNANSIKSNITEPIYINNYLLKLEFNIEFFIDLSFIFNDLIELKLYLFSKENFDFNNNDIILDYVSKYEIASIKIDLSLNNFEYTLSPLKHSKIILNFIPLIKNENFNLENFYYKDLTIGNDFYLISNLTTNAIKNLQENSLIPSLFKYKYYDINYDNEKKKFYNKLNSNIDESSINKILNNDIQLVNGILHNSKLSYTKDIDIYLNNHLNFFSDELNVKILCQFKGINQRNEILYYNYFTHQTSCHKINGINIIPLNKNIFNIIDFQLLIDNSLNNISNYKETKFIHFKNKIEIFLFINCLKKIKRQKMYNKRFELKKSNIEKVILDNDLQMNINDYSSKKKYIKILLEKIGFTQNYTIDYDYNVFFNILKNTNTNTNLNLMKKTNNKKINLMYYLLNNSLIDNNKPILNQNNSNNYSESEMEELNIGGLKESYFLKKELFNKGIKYINLNKREIVCFEINDTEKKYDIEVLLLSKDNKYKIQCYSEINIENIIRESNKKINIPVSEYFVIPIYVEKDDKIIIGKINLKIICTVNNNLKNFDEEYNMTIKNYITENKFKNKDIMLIGTYEPNILRRFNMKVIHSKLKKTVIDLLNSEKENLNNFLSFNGLNCYNFIPYISGNDNNPYLTNNISQYIINTKLNEFYSNLTLHKWTKLFNRFLKIKINTNNINEIFENFPSTEKIISLYISGHYIFDEIKKLFYLGLPNIESRKIIWNKILSIDNLYQLTISKLTKYKNVLNNKGDIYNFFYNISNNNNPNFSLSLIDTFIDNDVLFIENNYKKDINIIKNITKAFYQWCALKINLYNGNTNYIYFTGVLYLVKRLFHIFHSPSETFWILIGLSQVLEIFTENYQLNNFEEYILIIKLLLEKYHKNIYNQLISLNFPLEYFISRNMSSFYSNYFHNDELYLKFLDIVIFESIISKNEKNDKRNYLRLLVTIPLTILSINEKYIIEVRNAFQLENLLKCLRFQNYNQQLFIKTLNDNINKYFYLKNSNSVIQNWLKFINNSIDENVVWDKKRNEILILYDSCYYSLIKNEYKNFSKGKFYGSILQNENKINIDKWKKVINKKIDIIQNDLNFNDKNKLVNGILFIVKKVFHLNNEKTIKLNNQKISYYVNKNNISHGNIIIRNNGYVNFIDNDKSIFNTKYINEQKEKLCIQIGNEKDEIFIFEINLKNIDLLNPISIQIQSNNVIENIFCIIEITLMKYYSPHLNHNEINDIYSTFFSHSNFHIDFIMKDKLYQLNNNEKIKNKMNYENNNFIYSFLKENSNKLPNIDIYYLKRNIFHFDENYKILNNNNNKILKIKLTEILTELFNLENKNGKEIAKLIIEWYLSSNNNITILEILYSIFLDHCSNNININDILYNLFCLCSLENKNSFVNISSIINCIYCIYKKFCFNFSYYEISYMVNYFFKKEKYCSIKNVIVFNKNNLKEVKDFIYDKNQYNKDIKSFLRNKSQLFQDITTEFIYNLNNIYSIYKEVEEINGTKNKNISYTLNNNSKDNILFILNYIYIKKGFLDETYDSIILEYNKEFSNEEFYFKINKEKNEIFFDDINSIYSFNYYYKSNSVVDIYKSILFYSYSNLFLSNTNNNYINIDINFDVFKKLIFNLPYLSDLIYKNCFLSSYYNSNLINDKTFSNKIVFYNNIKVNIIDNFKKLIDFTFSDNEIKHVVKEKSFFIKYSLNSFNTIKDIHEMILNKLLTQTLQIDNSEKIKQSLYNLNLIKININDNNNNDKDINPNSNLYLLINNEEFNINKNIEINFDISNKGNTKRGYSKFYFDIDNNYYEWRKCIIKNELNNNIDLIEYDSIKNNLIKIILKKDKNIIINRENLYDCI